MKLLPVEVYRKAADAITYGRVMATGAILGGLATAPEEDQYSWGRAAAYAATGIADGADGRVVRMHPNGPTPDGAIKDEKSDKAASYATELTLALKHVDLYAGISVAVDLVRDNVVRHKREQLRTADLDAKARPLGKYKTAWKFLTNSFALSPLAEKYPKALQTMRVGGMILTVVSGVDFVLSANRTLSEYDFSVHQHPK